MSKLVRCGALLVVLGSVGCLSMGEPVESTPTPSPAPGDDSVDTGPAIDSDGDGSFDGVDIDGDGRVDISFVPSEQNDALILAGLCSDPWDMLIDFDGDGIYDAIDFNCDQVIDLQLPQPNPNPDQTEGGSCSVTVNNLRVDCQSQNGTSQCSCFRNGALVSTCSTPGEAVCSIPGSCCQF